MNDRERRASKYLPFDSLKGLKEAIEKEDTLYKNKRPQISEEEKLQMNLILFECYSKNKAIKIHYYTEGKMMEYSGVIQRIDILNKYIVLLPKKKFHMEDIYQITMR